MRSKFMLKRKTIIIIAVIMAVLIKIALFLRLPNPHIDYVKAYNQLTYPTQAAYLADSNNAAALYGQAFAYAVKMPRMLEENSYACWPNDFDEPNRISLENWLGLNNMAFVFLANAVDKPFYWQPCECDKEMLVNMKLNDIVEFRNINRNICWDAKVNAYNGKYIKAFEEILTCYKSGIQKSKPPTVSFNQVFGTDIKNLALNTAFCILSRSTPDSNSMKYFQARLENLVLSEKVLPDYSADKLMMYDVVQHTFLNNPWGTGRLSIRRIKWLVCLCDACKYVWVQPFVGPTSNQMKKRIDDRFAEFDLIKELTPYQLSLKKPGILFKLQYENDKTNLLAMFGPNFEKDFEQAWSTRANAQALVLVLAILRYNIDQGHLPITLHDLTEKKYVNSIPVDPYGADTLKYVFSDTSFILYSFGKDMKDNGGVSRWSQIKSSKNKHMSTEGYDVVYWPVWFPKPQVNH